VGPPVDKRTALFIAAVSSFLNPYMATAVNVALPAIGREFALNAVTLSWVTTAYLLAAAVCLVPFARVSDLWGLNRVFLLGVSIYTASALLCIFAPSAALLIAFRAAQGIGGAMIFSTSTAIVVTVYPQAERGGALGLIVACVYAGQSLGPVLGGILTEHFGWRSIFVALMPLGIATIVLTLSRLRGEWAPVQHERFDLGGAVIYAAMFIALIYGLTQLPAVAGAAYVLAGLVGVLLFIRREDVVPEPILDVRLFRTNRVFALSNLAALLNYAATYAIAFLLSLYLQYVRGFGPDQAGLVLLAQPIVQAASSPYAGRLSDRIDPRGPASLGMALTAAGLFLLSLLHTGTSTAFIVMSLLVVGLGFGLFSSPNTNAVMSAVDARIYGVASGTLSTMRLTGQMLSMGIVTMIFNIFLGSTTVTPALREPFVAATRTAFLTFGFLCVGGILASLARGERHAQDPPSAPAAARF